MNDVEIADLSESREVAIIPQGGVDNYRIDIDSIPIIKLPPSDDESTQIDPKSIRRISHKEKRAIELKTNQQDSRSLVLANIREQYSLYKEEQIKYTQIVSVADKSIQSCQKEIKLIERPKPGKKTRGKLADGQKKRISELSKLIKIQPGKKLKTIQTLKNQIVQLIQANANIEHIKVTTDRQLGETSAALQNTLAEKENLILATKTEIDKARDIAFQQVQSSVFDREQAIISFQDLSEKYDKLFDLVTSSQNANRELTDRNIELTNHITHKSEEYRAEIDRLKTANNNLEKDNLKWEQTNSDLGNRLEEISDSQKSCVTQLEEVQKFGKNYEQIISDLKKQIPDPQILANLESERSRLKTENINQALNL